MQNTDPLIARPHFDGGELSPDWDPVRPQFARLLCESVTQEHFPELDSGQYQSAFNG